MSLRTHLVVCFLLDNIPGIAEDSRAFFMSGNSVLWGRISRLRTKRNTYFYSGPRVVCA